MWRSAQRFIFACLRVIVGLHSVCAASGVMQSVVLPHAGDQLTVDL
jgi:hypothetical protein